MERLQSIAYSVEKSSLNRTGTQLSIESIARIREALHRVLKEANPIRSKFEAELDTIGPYNLSVEEVEDRLDALHTDLFAALETNITTLKTEIAALEADERERTSRLAAEHRAQKDRAKQQRQAAHGRLKAKQLDARQNAEREWLERSEAARLEGVAARKHELAERAALST